VRKVSPFVLDTIARQELLEESLFSSRDSGEILQVAKKTGGGSPVQRSRSRSPVSRLSRTMGWNVSGATFQLGPEVGEGWTVQVRFG
jgi:hypothetical protein